MSRGKAARRCGVLVRHMTRRFLILSAIALGAAGCGGSSYATRSSSPSTATPTTATPTTAAATTATATPARAAVAPPSLRILLPARGALTAATVSVRVVVHRAPAGAQLRYVLDSGRPQPARPRFTLNGLAPGRHRLVVFLAADRAVRTATTFDVQPPPAPVPAATAPVQAPPTTTPAPPPPTTTTTTSAPPPPTNPIPQHNGGDADGDNNGAPSDGDGNV